MPEAWDRDKEMYTGLQSSSKEIFFPFETERAKELYKEQCWKVAVFYSFRYYPNRFAEIIL